MVSYDWTITAQDIDCMVKFSLKTPEAKKARRQGMLRLGLCAALSFLVMAYFLFLKRDSDLGAASGLIAFLCCLGCLCLFQCIFLPVNQKQVTNRSVRQGDPRRFSGTRHFEFREEGLVTSSDFGNSLRFWNGFRYWGLKGNYLFLVDTSSFWIMIDRNDISESDLQEIENLLRSQQVPFIELT